MQKFVINGRLDDLNKYTRANRTNQYKGASVKKTNQNKCRWWIQEAHLKPVKHYPVRLMIRWFEKDSRRDVDNITFAVKFILDALVDEGILEDDARRYVCGIDNSVYVDRHDPRIEIKIFESEED